MSSLRRRLMMAQGIETPKFEIDPCIYITSISNQSVRIINKKEYAKRIYLEDSTELDISGSGPLDYTFSNVGEHKVWIELNENLYDFSSCFSGCNRLYKIQNGLLSNCKKAVNLSRFLYWCTSLVYIPIDLFLNNNLVNDFSNCFEYCSLLDVSTPKDADGGELWEREGKSGYPSSINGYRCFYMCSKIKNYSSIPEDWK